MLHHHLKHAPEAASEGPSFEGYVCWTKMQAEAGQSIEAIVARKERERLAGDGLFMWGVGNAPALLISTLARLGRPVPVVFSLMKSRPKSVDTAPSRTLIWRRYIDSHGHERELPPNAIVTSRGPDDWANKRHYALMCYSPSPLAIVRGEAFDHRAYRNASGTGAPVGASQVTSLLRQVDQPSSGGDYEANFRAELTQSYWVRLADPALLSASQAERLDKMLGNAAEPWLDIAREMRGPPTHRNESGGRLFI